jgi:hypothetical protein
MRLMDDDMIATHLENLDRRLAKVEQILPTLATKDELRAAVSPLATKEELRAAIAPLATKEELREKANVRGGTPIKWRNACDATWTCSPSL